MHPAALLFDPSNQSGVDLGRWLAAADRLTPAQAAAAVTFLESLAVTTPASQPGGDRGK